MKENNFTMGTVLFVKYFTLGTEQNVKFYKKDSPKSKKEAQMIDNLKARQVLKKYIEKYDFSNPRIKLKAAHIYRVADVAKQIATELKLSQEQVELAELIGLLHDIGRFEQLRIYDTFKDRESVNHAEMGVKVLKENDFIKEFCNDEKYYDIIYIAILNHNKYKIEDGLDSEILLQSKIIRDADKIDILNLLVFETFETLYKRKEIIDEPITEKVLNAMLEGKQVERKDQKTAMDDWASNIGYIYDINFKPSFKILKEKDYINKIINRTKTPEMEKIRNYVNKYIDEKIAE